MLLDNRISGPHRVHGPFRSAIDLSVWLSAKKTEKDIEKETIVDAPQKVKKEIISEIKSEKTISEENYK